MTEKQKELYEKHGTPLEFDRACFSAHISLEITFDEYLAGVRDYIDEWNAAGENNREDKEENAK